MKTLLLWALLTLAAAKPRQMVPRNTEAAIPEGRKPETNYHDCGVVIKSSEGTIESPNYPNDYPADATCYWVLKAPVGKRIKLRIWDMQIVARAGGACLADQLVLRYNDMLADDVNACGSELIGRTYTSADNIFALKFKTGSNSGGHRGFTAEIAHVWV